MYNIDFKCNYHKLMYLKNEKLIEQSQTLYRGNFLKCLNLTEYNDDLVNSAVNDLYEKIKYNNEFSIILEKLEKALEKTTAGILSIFYSNEEKKNKSTIFMFLLSYDYLFLFHECMKEFLNGTLTENSYYYKLLLEKIEFPDFFQNEHIKESIENNKNKSIKELLSEENIILK